MLYPMIAGFGTLAPTRAGHEPSRAELDPSLALARSGAARLGSARSANEPTSTGSARFGYGSAQTEPARKPVSPRTI